MDNQHKLISGYRDLTQEEIDLMNMVKVMGNSLNEMLEALSKVEHIDMRWLAISQTDLQTGIMAAVRSIARPESF